MITVHDPITMYAILAEHPEWKVVVRRKGSPHRAFAFACSKHASYTLQWFGRPSLSVAVSVERNNKICRYCYVEAVFSATSVIQTTDIP